MKLRITITFSPDLGDTRKWPSCKTGQDAADRVQFMLQGLRVALGLVWLTLDVTAVEDGQQ